VFGDSDDPQTFDPQPGRSLRLFSFTTRPLLDGYREDWGIAAEPQELPSSGLGARVLAAATERHSILSIWKSTKP